jgi:aerobic-type carbon monoxide dehydrogenase small subunit (CoxS/CutS family)
MRFTLNGDEVDVDDGGATLLDLLRERLGITSAKDGCSPQGQCGCCTVLVDGAPRVACVTPARRVAGRSVTTLEGLDPSARDAWAAAFTATGASQCGFCTPGILLRLAALGPPGTLEAERVDTALLAHLCRCTGWQTIVEAATTPGFGEPGGSERPSNLSKAGERASIEGRVDQRVGPDVALGRGGFSEDTAPADALVAVPIATGGWAVGETLAEARRNAGKVQGRRTTLPPTHPLELPPGEWDLTLRTTWIEPAYLEPDASWCAPGGEPSSPLANGGAFGGKTDSPAPAAARRLADEHGRPVRVVLSREDTVRLGPKRPPIAAGLRADGTGVVRVVRTPGIAERITSVLPGVEVEEVDVPGPPTSAALRAAGWAEAWVLRAALAGHARVTTDEGAVAEARIDPADGTVHVTLDAGDLLDATVLRSYAIGAAHLGLGWVTSEGIAVDAEGEVHDLTIRSFGILRAKDLRHIDVELVAGDGPPVNGSDAVFAAVAAAAWLERGRPTDWPTERGSRS